jgi:hypothetical protein
MSDEKVFHDVGVQCDVKEMFPNGEIQSPCIPESDASTTEEDNSFDISIENDPEYLPSVEDDGVR